MKKIRIEYMRFRRFPCVKEFYIPEKWEDLTERQFAVCAGIYVDPLPDVEFIAQFFDLSINLVKRFSQFEQYKLTELAGFAMKPTGTVNFFFVEEIPGTGLHSPESRLRNVTFEQFSLFDTFFFDYANEPTDDHLCRMVAAMYLKKGEKVTAIDFEKRVDLIARKVDKATQYAIFLNYVFLRDWLSKAFLFLFEKADPEDETAKSKRKFTKAAKPTRPDWNGILDGLVADDILHSDDYKQIRCLVAFKTINNRIKTYRKNGN